MVQLLLRAEHTVGDLADACDIPSHVASEHLRKMKDRGLLASRRDGRCNYYRVQDPSLPGVMRCLEKRHSRRR
jgi:DNA-binding MarR family transcriptional regulator